MQRNPYICRKRFCYFVKISFCRGERKSIDCGNRVVWHNVKKAVGEGVKASTSIIFCTGLGKTAASVLRAGLRELRAWQGFTWLSHRSSPRAWPYLTRFREQRFSLPVLFTSLPSLLISHSTHHLPYRLIFLLGVLILDSDQAIRLLFLTRTYFIACLLWRPTLYLALILTSGLPG